MPRIDTLGLLILVTRLLRDILRLGLYSPANAVQRGMSGKPD